MLASLKSIESASKKMLWTSAVCVSQRNVRKATSIRQSIKGMLRPEQRLTKQYMADVKLKRKIDLEQPSHTLTKDKVELAEDAMSSIPIKQVSLPYAFHVRQPLNVNERSVFGMEAKKNYTYTLSTTIKAAIVDLYYKKKYDVRMIATTMRISPQRIRAVLSQHLQETQKREVIESKIRLNESLNPQLELIRSRLTLPMEIMLFRKNEAKKLNITDMKKIAKIPLNEYYQCRVALAQLDSHDNAKDFADYDAINHIYNADGVPIPAYPEPQTRLRPVSYPSFALAKDSDYLKIHKLSHIPPALPLIPRSKFLRERNTETGAELIKRDDIRGRYPIAFVDLKKEATIYNRRMVVRMPDGMLIKASPATRKILEHMTFPKYKKRLREIVPEFE